MSKFLTEVSSYESFISALKTAASRSSTFYGYFLSERNSDGQMWCPDCISADPIVQSYLATQPDAETVLMWVEKTSYRTPNFPFKSDDSIQLKALPQINKYVVQDGNFVLASKLVEDEITSESLSFF